MKKLYRFDVDFGRMGSLIGTFVADDEVIKRSMGKEVYFGEVLGKHSEVTVTLEDEDFRVLTDDQDFIEKFESFGCASGYSPFHYMSDEDSDEVYNYETFTDE